MIPGRPKVIPGHPKSTPEPPKEYPRLILDRFRIYFGAHFGAKDDLILMSFFDIILDTEKFPKQWSTLWGIHV